MADKSAFEAALAQARAAAQKFREEGKLPPEEKVVKPVAPAGSQQIIAAGGQEYRDLGLGNTYRRHSRAIEQGPSSGGGGGSFGGGGGSHHSGGGGSHGGGGSGGAISRFSGPAIGRGGGHGGSNYSRPMREFTPDQFNKNSYNSSFQRSDGIGPQGAPSGGRDRSPVGNRGGNFRGRGRGGHGGDPRAMDERRNRYSGNQNPWGDDNGGGGRDPWGAVSGVSYRGKRGRNQNNDDGEFEEHDPDQDYKIFVGGLHKDTTTESLQAYFEQYGKIKYCQVKLDPASGASRGFGFILYEQTDSVDNVIKNLPHTVDGKRVDAKRQHFKSKDKDDKLFVGGIPSDFTDGQLADYFSPYGMVDAVERPRDQTTGMAKGFAFITFKDPAVVETIVGQRWLTLPNGARIECKKQHQYQGKSKNQNQYADTSGSVYMDHHGMAYVGDDWQNFDWTKAAEPQQQDPMAGGMNFPGMEGMSQKEMKKACKKMMKQWSQMMNMMATGDMSAMMGGGGDGSGMSQEQMQQMMAQMGGGGAVPPPPPDY